MASNPIHATQSSTECVSQWSELLPVVGQPRRRQLLTSLQQTSPQPIDDLIAQIDPRHTTEHCRAIRLSLQHVHLPLLADHGFIDWDRDTGEIRRGPCFDAIEPVLALMETLDNEFPVEELPEPNP